MKKIFAVGVVALASIFLAAAPAFAHQNSISGTVSCDTETGEQVVVWSNTGDAVRFGDAVITASNRAAVATGQTITAGTTIVVGTETFPNDATGTVTLTETWFWAKDQFHNTNSGSVELGIECSEPTSSTPPPTTPPPTSSSSTPPPSSSTPPPSTSTVPPTTPPTHTPTEHDPTPTPTAFTGGSVAAPGALAGVLTLLGLGSLWWARRKAA